MIDVRSVSAQLLIQAARQQRLHVRVLSKRNNFFEVSDDRQSFLIQATALPINTQTGARIANNKFLTKKILLGHHLPVPKSWVVKNASELRKIVAKYSPYPLVIKPVEGSHGTEVFSHIEDKQELEGVIQEIFTKKTSREILVEEHVSGRDLRVFVVGKTVPAVLERIPAHVIGDGEKNIRQLVKEFNHHPLVGKKYEKPMCKIHLTKEEKRILAKQNLTIWSIPDNGQRVWLRNNANISTGGIGKDVTDTTPQWIKDLAIKACAAVGLQVSGLDIIFNDITQKAFILEINDTAGIDVHHFPAVGKTRDVAGVIMKYLFSDRSLLLEPSKIPLKSDHWNTSWFGALGKFLS